MALTYGSQSKWVAGGASGFYDTPGLRCAALDVCPTAWSFKLFLPVKSIHLSAFHYNINNDNTSGTTLLDNRLCFWAIRVTGIRKDGTRKGAYPVMLINGSRVADADKYSGMYLDNGNNHYSPFNFASTRNCSWDLWMNLKNHTHAADVLFGDFEYWVWQYVCPQVLMTSKQSFSSALFYLRRLTLQY